MDDWKLYTPDGVQDLLFEQCYLKRNMEQNIREHLRRGGYYELETPSLEFYDAFATGAGAIEQEVMYKLVDQQGRLLVLRPDLTIPAARVYATKLKNLPLPLKLFYIGNAFKYNAAGGGRSKEFTQAGLEIIGAPGSAADAEAIAEAILLAKAMGLEEFQIDIGQVDFFKGVVEEAGFDEVEREAIRTVVDRKDYAQLEHLLSEKDLPASLHDLLLGLPKLFGDTEVLDKAVLAARNERSLRAIQNLREILTILEEYGLRQYVSIDLGMVNSLHYYTGTIFKGFTYGVGFPFLSGGRYDTLIGNFGEPVAATGFSMGINLVMQALSRQGQERPDWHCDAFVGYQGSARQAAIETVSYFRDLGISTQLDLCGFSEEEALDYAEASSCRMFVYLRNDETVRYCNFKKGTDTSFDFTTMMEGGWQV